MTCASKTAAATCSPGYYVETTGKCTPCPDTNSYCKSKDDYGTCKPTFYYDTTAKKCTTCGTNAYLCNAAPVSGADTGIDECKEPDASSVYFKTSKGCVASTTTNKCKTVIADGTKCASCFTGYVIDTGVCKFCKSSIYFTGTER